MSGLSYDNAWTFLDRLQFFKIKLGLDSMNEFLHSLGHPHKKFPTIHIGGTNGKGSVGATLLSILHESGRNVGFYTSPHLSSVRERFRIGDRYISRHEFAEQAEKIIGILDGRQITYFEFTTALAMLWFADMQVDLAILEVGLGGRLDATNVVEPLVSVITTVSMDHEQHLGNTITEVAREKAGIIKPEVPLVTGVTTAAPLAVLTATAEKLKSPAYILGRDFKGTAEPADMTQWSYEGIPGRAGGQQIRYLHLPLAMKGDYQVNNAAVALAALETVRDHFPLQESHIRSGLKKVTWPGRLEEFWIDPQGKIIRGISDRNSPYLHFLLDGAHNPEGAQSLKRSLLRDFYYQNLLLVWASMADKDMNGTLLAIAPLAREIIFTRPEAERSAPPESLLQLLPENLQSTASCMADVKDAIKLAAGRFRPGDMICIAGSLYLVGKARQLLCGELVPET
ncbi:MAG: folylpolyglutamate synthase/dihydrofolate synthase family protein [Desulfobulbaceae bacterium]|nr:folylpolyglutamate synthase/dihydrofolate synthase family protein [Desulfobulbaceae bacterium]